MRKIVKKLELKRETVRTLVAKTGIRAGEAPVGDVYVPSSRIPTKETNSTPSGNTGGYVPPSDGGGLGNNIGGTVVGSRLNQVID